MVIQCSNPTCRAEMATPIGRCQVCQTPLLYRFLLAVSDRPLTLSPYTLVANRYQVWHHPIWLDTQPEAPIPALEIIPPPLLPYLRLSALTQHIPRPHYYLSTAESTLEADVLLLDAAPLALSLDALDQLEVTLLPSLTEAWAQGTALQQVNWLRQMASLWFPLSQEQVAATLLVPEALRVDQSLLRLTTLVPDQTHSTPVSLVTLGQQWLSWTATAQPALQAYLRWLGEALIDGTIRSSAELVAELEQALQTLAQGLSVTVDWVANTDQGPSRDRNEDACYPQGEEHQQQWLSAQPNAGQPLPLLLVCDGIGGHEQGNIASQTAIQRLLEELQPLAQQPDLPPTAVSQHLKQAIILANNAIVNRNNDEQRSARARMGTTVVVALVHFPYVFLAHLGDSRAYRVSRRTCYQITLDDDVASREAHMGYALYQEAAQMPGGGALVQALGINDSNYLYPTVQYLCLDDPVVLLLCSDGLSDSDRVEALWPFTVRPGVGNPTPLAPVSQTLIQQANHLNGHDNVTVGLMRFLPQTQFLPTLPGQRLRSGEMLPSPLPSAATVPTQVPRPKTTLLITAKEYRHPWGTVLAGATASLLMLAGVGWAYYGARPRPLLLHPVTPVWPTRSLVGQPLWPLAQALTTDIALASFWQVGNPSTLGNRFGPLRLLPSPTAGVTPAVNGSGLQLPTGSILKVVRRQTQADQTQWLRLQVCSIPSGSSLTQVPTESSPTQPVPVEPSSNPSLTHQLAQPGDEGWAKAYHLYSTATALTTVTPTQAGGCSAQP